VEQRRRRSSLSVEDRHPSSAPPDPPAASPASSMAPTPATTRSTMSSPIAGHFSPRPGAARFSSSGGRETDGSGTRGGRRRSAKASSNSGGSSWGGAMVGMDDPEPEGSPPPLASPSPPLPPPPPPMDMASAGVGPPAAYGLQGLPSPRVVELDFRPKPRPRPRGRSSSRETVRVAEGSPGRALASMQEDAPESGGKDPGTPKAFRRLLPPAQAATPRNRIAFFAAPRVATSLDTGLLAMAGPATRSGTRWHASQAPGASLASGGAGDRWEGGGSSGGSGRQQHRSASEARRHAGQPSPRRRQRSRDGGAGGNTGNGYGDRRHTDSPKHSRGKDRSGGVRAFRGWKVQRRPEITLKDLQVSGELGAGQFGRVLCVAWRPPPQSPQVAVPTPDGAPSPEPGSTGVGGALLPQALQTGGSPAQGASTTAAFEELFALKILDRKRFKNARHEQMVLLEKEIMHELDHPFHIRLINTFKTPTRLFLLTELAPGRDLGKLLRSKGPVDVSRCRFYTANLLLALQHMHSRGIIHRDIKPSNILVSADGYLKVCDYGFAKHLPRGAMTATFVGTYEYLSPELCKKSYGHGVDLWSLGICIYEMVFGRTPFHHDYNDSRYSLKVIRNIQTRELVYPSQRQPFPLAGKLLLNAMLEKNVLRRLGTKLEYPAIMSHAFFTTTDWASIESQVLAPPL